jgi:glycosyltransferase involved in cell wall biosynthesis
MNPLGVSVVICCYNSSLRLPETIARLNNQIVPINIPWEVIVIDNASTDRTSEVAKNLWQGPEGVSFRIESEPNPGLMNARKKGFESAKFDFINFIDDDNWVANNWVNKVYDKMLEYPEAGAIAGLSAPVFESPPPYWFEKYKGWYAVGKLREGEGEMPEGQMLWGAGITVRRSAWFEITQNSINPMLRGREGKRLTSGEDLEMCLMISKAGWKLYFIPDLLLHHYIPSTRLTWKYLCNLYRANGQCHLYLDFYQDPRIKNTDWKKGIFNEVNYIIRRPVRLVQALLYQREDDPLLLRMERHIGALSERLRLLGNLERCFDAIGLQVKKLKDLKDRKNN